MAPVTTFIATKLGASATTSALVGKATIASMIAGGSLLNVVGSLREGEATDAQSRLEAEMAKAQALAEERRGLEEERLRRREGEKLHARQKALYARAGVKVGEGSPLLVLAETLLDTSEDISFIRESTQAKASAFRMKATTFRGIGKAARTSSRYKAGQSLLTGIQGLTGSNP